MSGTRGGGGGSDLGRGGPPIGPLTRLARSQMRLLSTNTPGGEPRAPAAPPAGLVRRPAAPTRADSFDALFVAGDALVAPVPVAFHLLELVRPLLYPDPATIRSEYAVRYPNGLAINVELHGNTKLGVPALFDLDVYFATRVIAVDRGRGLDDVLPGVTLREIGRVLGVPNSQQNGEFLGDVMSSLDRLSGFKIVTDFDFGQVQRATEANAGRARPFLPDALPRRVRPKRHWHYLLQVGLDEATEAGSDGGRDVIGGIRFDPVWVDSVASGATAWVDFRLYRALSDRYAKLLYQAGLVRVLRHPTWSAHEPWDVSVADLLRSWGVDDVRTRTRRFVVDKLAGLEAMGVFGAWRETTGRGDQHRVVLEPGERLLAARAYTGVRAEESPEIARLVWALQHGPWRFSLPEARYWAEATPRVALRVLQRAVYLCEVGWEPKASWSSWVKDALKEGYEFEFDARYVAWLDARLRGYALPAFVDPRRLTRGDLERLEAPTGATGDGAGGSDAASDAAGLPDGLDVDAPALDAEAEVFEDTLWGRVRGRLAGELDPSVYRTWLQPLRCLEADAVSLASPAPLRLEAPDAFSAEWIAKKYTDRIAALAAEFSGAATPVVVTSAAAGAVVRRGPAVGLSM